MTNAYPARFRKDDDAIGVSFRDLSGAHTWGRDRPEAELMAADCLLEALADRMRMGEEIPGPSRSRSGERMVPLGPLASAKLGLYSAMREEGVSVSELARRLAIDRKDVRRLLDLGHGSHLDRLAAALAAVGRELVLDVRRAKRAPALASEPV